MGRKRTYIPLPEKLAATLACLLPQEDRDLLRETKVSSAQIISLFHFDHVILHAFEGSDEWWNLDPKLISPHREKSKRDTSIVAKAKRIDKKWTEFTSTVLRQEKDTKIPSRWPKQRLQSRGFQKRSF